MAGKKRLKKGKEPKKLITNKQKLQKRLWKEQQKGCAKKPTKKWKITERHL